MRYSLTINLGTPLIKRLHVVFQHYFFVVLTLMSLLSVACFVSAQPAHEQHKAVTSVDLSSTQHPAQKDELAKRTVRFYVVAHTSVEKLNENQIKSLFSLQKQLLPNNKRAMLAVLVPTHDATNVMSQHFFNYFAYQLQRLWDREVFAGRAVAPQQFDSPKEMLTYISNTQNAIGYIDAATFDAWQIKGDIHVIATFI